MEWISLMVKNAPSGMLAEQFTGERRDLYTSQIGTGDMAVPYDPIKQYSSNASHLNGGSGLRRVHAPGSSAKFMRNAVEFKQNRAALIARKMAVPPMCNEIMRAYCIRHKNSGPPSQAKKFTHGNHGWFYGYNNDHENYAAKLNHGH